MRNRIDLIIFLPLLFLTHAVFAQSEQQAPSAPAGGLDQLLQITKNLKDAVCDESFISKAPALGGHLTTQNYQIWFDDEKREAEVLSFLLGEPTSAVSSEFLRDEINETHPENNEQVQKLKRKLSLEICENVVGATSKLRELVDKKPSRFLNAKEVTMKEPNLASLIAPSEKSGFLVLAQDREGRFGAFNKGILVPGWVEPFEVMGVAFVHKGKTQHIYSRLFNPITNNTLAIVLESTEGTLLGEFIPSPEATAKRDLTALKAQAEGEQARLRQLELYRSQIEGKAFHVLSNLKASNLDLEESRKKIRNLQEYYKNLLEAYKLFPQEKQFDIFSKNSPRHKNLDEFLKDSLTESFWSELSKAKVGANSVRFLPFKPDPKLEAIYAEYLKKLKTAI